MLRRMKIVAKIVAAGGGNSTSPLTIFVPYNIEIKAGESVTWNNPTPVAEPHSVTFMKDSKYFPAFVAPFQVPNSTEFQSLVPNSNAEPLIVPAPGESPQTKTVVTVNARAFIPVVLDSSGKNVTYLPQTQIILWMGRRVMLILAGFGLKDKHPQMGLR